MREIFKLVSPSQLVGLATLSVTESARHRFLGPIRAAGNVLALRSFIISSADLSRPSRPSPPPNLETATFYTDFDNEYMRGRKVDQSDRCHLSQYPARPTYIVQRRREPGPTIFDWICLELISRSIFRLPLALSLSARLRAPPPKIPSLTNHLFGFLWTGNIFSIEISLR